MPIDNPEHRDIAKAVIVDKLICRRCYARNPLNAHVCRRCKHNDLRPKSRGTRGT